MRTSTATCVWILVAAVLLLGVLAEGGHQKRKKIVVFVPQKVKHIHHHHVKKVYVKRNKPIEYIEDEDLHRAGEGGDVPWEQRDEVLHGGQDWGRGGVAALASPRTPPSLTPGTPVAHVGRAGELGDAQALATTDGWTALMHHVERPMQHPRVHSHEQQQVHPHPQHHHQHQPQHSKKHRPHPQNHQHQSNPEQQHSRPAVDFQKEDRHQRKNKPHQHLYQHQLHQLAEASETPEEIRAWVNEGFPKFHNSQANDALQDDEDVDDGIRVQVFQDGEEIPTQEVSQLKKEEPKKEHHHALRAQHSDDNRHAQPRPKQTHQQHQNHQGSNEQTSVGKSQKPAVPQQRRNHPGSRRRQPEPKPHHRDQQHQAGPQEVGHRPQPLEHRPRHRDAHHPVEHHRPQPEARLRPQQRYHHVEDQLGLSKEEEHRPSEHRLHHRKDHHHVEERLGPQLFHHDDVLPAGEAHHARHSWRQR